MALLKQDELNQIAIPYEQYFGEMGLSQSEIDRRIALAEALDDVFIMYFLLIESDRTLGRELDVNYYVDYITRNYEDVLVKFGIDTESKYPALPAHIKQAADEVVKQNKEKPDDAWYTSDDRAMVIAENETNAICEYTEFQDAVDSGKTKKTWNTMVDFRVRHTHMELEGKTIPIMDRFVVGKYEMYQPKDTSLGAGMEEIAGCRCWCTYT